MEHIRAAQRKLLTQKDVIMNKFTKLEKSSIITKNGMSVDVFKFKKEGTKREFFTPVYNEKRLTSTMFSRKYAPENYAKKFIEYRNSK